ncbi:hypothetical protein [Pseudomonas purpurea]|uniref:hypothetical protein n=1 Tax=Pseudomonas purpurea TaxID=3136737 RepID=UPI003267B5C1
MNESAALTLAKAIAAVRNGTPANPVLSSPLTPAQSGSALRLKQALGLSVAAEAALAVEQAEAVVRELFEDGTEAATLIGQAPSPQVFERVASHWFDPQESSDETEIAAGYWLADAFLRGIETEEAQHLTRFLAGASPRTHRHAVVSARRYPTGGISEKQALLLPPLMRALAADFHWCSPFLVAPRLAHTGGTRDKLSVIPGFEVSSVSELPHWDGRDKPVRYFAADAQLCPRDAMMYRIRGETGTVADTGLMAASIMSKQITLPADVIILDILHGPTAFLHTAPEAAAFGTLCEDIGRSNGITIVAQLRQSASLLGRSVGASTEVVEIAELLRGGAPDEAGQLELSTALGFLHTFAHQLKLDPNAVTQRAKQAIASGEAFQAMVTLWADHGAENTFLRAFARDPRQAILGDLPQATLRAERSGNLTWDAIALADVANNQVNVRLEPSPGVRVVAGGGIELLCRDGAQVQQGDALAVIYGQAAGVAVGALGGAATIG